MNISEFYAQARTLLADVGAGRVDPTTLSDEGRLALDIAAKKVSVNDLSNEGRTALGIDPLPEPQGIVTSPQPFGSKVGEALTTFVFGSAGPKPEVSPVDISSQGEFEIPREAPVGGVIHALGLDELAKRTGELATGAIEAVKEVPGQVKRAGQSFSQAADLALQGQFGHAAAELGGGLAETGSALLGIGAPMTIPLAAPAAAVGMATEQAAKWTGLPEKVKVGAAEITPRGVGELVGMGLVPGVQIWAGKTPRVRMPKITDPELMHLKYGMLHERINVSQEAKNPNIGEGTRAQLNARAATLRQAERELQKGTYTNKGDLFKILYDQTSAEARDAATRTQYFDPIVAGREATVQPGGAVNLTGREDVMGGAAPRVADVGEVQRSEVKQAFDRIGLDPNLYIEPVETTPTAGVVETPTAQPTGRPAGVMPAGIPDNVVWPSMREIAPETLESAATAAVKGERGVPEGQTQFPEMYGITLEEPGKAPGKGKTKRGPKGKRSQLVNIIKTANPELSTGAAVKVARITEEATAKVEAAQTKAELPPVPRRTAPTPAIEPPSEPTPAEITQESREAIDAVVLDDATAKMESKPPVAQEIRPVVPTPENTPVIEAAPAVEAPPVESAAPVPAQPRVTKPKGREATTRQSTIKKLLKSGFTAEETARMDAVLKSMSPEDAAKAREALHEHLNQGLNATQLRERVSTGGGFEPITDRQVLNELAGQVSIGEAGGGAEVPLEGEFWRPPEGVAQATAPTTRKPSAAALPELTRLSYKSANDVLKSRGRKLVISTEADPGKPRETVFLLQKLDGSPVLDETGRRVSYATPEAAVEAATLEGPGAMAATPASIAKIGLDPTVEAKSANLTVQKILREAGIPQGDLGVFTSHLRLNTPAFVTRFDPNAHLIFSHAVNTDIRVVKFVNSLRKRVREISEQLADSKEEGDLFLMGKVSEMKPEQAKAFLAQVSPNVKRLWQLHHEITDLIFEQVKRSDPTVRYRKDYISQFPLDSAIEQYANDLKHAYDMKQHFPNDPRYDAQAKAYEDLLTRINEQRNQIENMRYERQPDGSYFSPLNEARMLNLDYHRSYLGVMERYLDGVERKLFLDRTLPVFKRYMKADSLANKPIMRTYMHDWMNGLRGMYGRRWKMAIENSLEAFGVDNPFERQRWATDFDSMTNVVNGFQAMLYMGLRFKSVVNNAFQTLMTTYTEVGANSYSHGLASLFTKRGREFARQLGVVDFVPDNLGELYREASDAFRTRNPLKIINAATTAGVRYTLRPFQVIEWGNNIISANAGFHYARTTLKYDPFKAAEYARAMALRTNYIMRPVNTPLAFTGPLGKMGGFLQRFKVNYMEQLIQNYERFQKGERAPFVRQLGVYLALTGTEGLVIYNLASDYVMKKFGWNWPKINPLKWALDQGGLPGGDFFENMAPSLAVITPGAGGDVTGIIKPVPVQTLQNIVTQGAGAFVPSAVRDVSRSAVEMAQGGAMSTRTGKQIAQRPGIDVLMSSVALQPWAEGLRNRYLGQIAAALEGGRVDVAMRLANEARQKGLRITGNELQAIRQSVRERSRGSSTAGQLWQQIVGRMGAR